MYTEGKRRHQPDPGAKGKLRRSLDLSDGIADKQNCSIQGSQLVFVASFQNKKKAFVVTSKPSLVHFKTCFPALR